MSAVAALIAERAVAIAIHDAADDDDAAAMAQIDRMDDALIAICRARPISPAERELRRRFLSAMLVKETDGCVGLAQAVFDALLAGDGLDDLVEAHKAAIAAYDADHEVYDKENDINGHACDDTRAALLAHRPATLDEARRKAAFMAETKTFTEWDDIDKIDLIKALTPAEGAA